MPESKNQPEEKKKSPLGPILFIFAIVAVVICIGLINSATTTDTNSGTEMAAAEATSSSETETETGATQETPAEEMAQTESAAGEEKTENMTETASDFDLKKAATPRILGNPEAPVKISEHSSFTCGACAAFHASNFKSIKKDYIDTGKAYLVFDDFPRNQFDITIGAVARCVPDEAYFNFVQLLFETQKDWLNDDYTTYLKQNAMLTGASKDDIQNCMDSKELYEELAKRQQAAMKQHGVNATPTLVINDAEKVSGLSPYSEIQKVLDAAYAAATK